MYASAIKVKVLFMSKNQKIATLTHSYLNLLLTQKNPTMKKITTLFALLVACTMFVAAQTTEFEYIKTQYKSDKKTLLMNYMKLSDADATIFWPIYNKYEAERASLADKRFQNLKMYAETYSTISNEQADAMIKSYFENASKEISIEKKYYADVKKALGAKTAASWIQFEEYLDAAVKFEVLHNIPFVNPK